MLPAERGRELPHRRGGGEASLRDLLVLLHPAALDHEKQHAEADEDQHRDADQGDRIEHVLDGLAGGLEDQHQAFEEEGDQDGGEELRQAAPGFGGAAPILRYRRGLERRRAAARAAWPDAIDALAAGVRAGQGLPDCIADLSRTGPVELRSVFAAGDAELRASGDFAAAMAAMSTSRRFEILSGVLALAEPTGSVASWGTLQ